MLNNFDNIQDRKLALGAVSVAMMLGAYYSSFAEMPSSQGYLAEGFQVVTNHIMKDSLHNYTNQFKMYVALDGRWRMEIIDTLDRWPAPPRPVGPKQPKGLATHSVITHDGTNTYWVRDVRLPNGMGYSGTEGTNYALYASYISTGNMPLFYGWSEDGRSVLWLGFVGGSYMRILKSRTMPIPWLNPRRSLDAYGFRFEAQIESSPPYTLTEATFYRDKSLDLDTKLELERPELDLPRSRKEVQDRIKELELRGILYPDGSIASHYRLIEHTNFHGWKLPSKLLLERFWPRMKPSYNTIHSIWVTNVSLIETSVAYQPYRPYPRLVLDSRFRYRDDRHNLDTLNYSLKVGGVWPGTNDVALQKQFRESVPMTKRYNYASESSKRWSFAITLFVLAGFLPYILWRCSRHKHPLPK